VQSGEWGWDDWRILSSFAVAAVLMLAFVWRCGHHEAPVADLALFRARSFSVATVSTFTLAVAFYGMLLGNVLFLTTVWHYTIIQCGLALTPAPVIAVVSAVVAGRLADRRGQRVIVAPAAVLFACGAAWYALRVGAKPDFLGEWLPGALMSGAGIGAALPTLAGAAVSSLTRDLFAVGSAMNTVMRQAGAVLGVSLLVTIVGTPGKSEAHAAFREAWIFTAAVALAASGMSLLLGRRRSAVGADAAVPALAGEGAVKLAAQSVRGERA
jgi:MFS family permease